MRPVVVVLAVSLALLFLFAGGSKLIVPGMHFKDFREWGYSYRFVYVVGVVEVSGAALLLAPFLRFPPKARFYGALLLAADMAAGTATQIKAGQMDRFGLPLVLCILCLAVAWFGRPPELASNMKRR